MSEPTDWVKTPSGLFVPPNVPKPLFDFAIKGFRAEVKK